MNVYRHIENGCLYRIYRDRYQQLWTEALYSTSPKLTCVLKPNKPTHFSGMESFTLAYTE